MLLTRWRSPIKTRHASSLDEEDAIGGIPLRAEQLAGAELHAIEMRPREFDERLAELQRQPIVEARRRLGIGVEEPQQLGLAELEGEIAIIEGERIQPFRQRAVPDRGDAWRHPADHKAHPLRIDAARELHERGCRRGIDPRHAAEVDDDPRVALDRVRAGRAARDRADRRCRRR